MTRAKKPGVVETVYPDRESWMNGRLGKVTGSGAHKTITFAGATIKAGAYLAAAESIVGAVTIAEDELTSAQVLARGHELEPKAVERFEKDTGLRCRRGNIIWAREDDNRIAVSPDAPIGKKGSMKAALEVKCLLSAKHVEALFTQDIPENTSGYEKQKLQYFAANPQLEELYWGFYHPDFPAGMDFFYLKFTRKELKKEIDAFVAAEMKTTAKIREIVNKLTLYSPAEVQQMQEVHEELLSTQKSGLDAVYAGIKERE